MIISNKKKFIFVHIYKTGGTSVTDSLIPHARFREKVASKWFTKYILRLISIVFGLTDKGLSWFNGVHKHAKAIDIKNYTGSEVFEKYFVFSFVRNPYDLEVSKYHYIRGEPTHRDYDIAHKLTFKEFVIRELENRCPLQVDFLMEDNNLIVDYIGKTEQLDLDMEVISDRIGIKYEKPVRINSSKRDRDYDAYYDEELKNLVYEYFERDFITLGYER